MGWEARAAWESSRGEGRFYEREWSRAHSPRLIIVSGPQPNCRDWECGKLRTGGQNLHTAKSAVCHPTGPLSNRHAVASRVENPEAFVCSPDFSTGGREDFPAIACAEII